MQTNLQLIYESITQSSGINLKTKSRKREVVWARNIYFYFAKKHTKASLDKIGKTVDKDHATVLHGIKRYHDNIIYDDFKELVKGIKKELPHLEGEDIERLTKEELEIKMLYSNKKRLEKQIEIYKNIIDSDGCEFINEIKELSAEEKKHFEIYKWMPHKKMLEATKNKLNKQLCN